jgi:hypothetical protein
MKKEGTNGVASRKIRSVKLEPSSLEGEIGELKREGYVSDSRTRNRTRQSSRLD